MVISETEVVCMVVNSSEICSKSQYVTHQILSIESLDLPLIIYQQVNSILVYVQHRYQFFLEIIQHYVEYYLELHYTDSSFYDRLH